MLREDNSCVVSNTRNNYVFDAGAYLNEARHIFGSLDESENYIRSGIYIPEQAKDIISSLHLLGAKTTKDGHARLEALLIKIKKDNISDSDAGTCMDFIYRHLLEDNVDAALVAIAYPHDNYWDSYFIRSPRFCYFEIPADVLSYMTLSAIKHHLAKTCDMSEDILNKYLTENHVSSGGITKTIASKIDSALRDIKCCDISAGTGQLLNAAANFVANIRNKLTPYIGNNQDRTVDTFLRHYISDSVYAADCDDGALEALKAELRLYLPGIIIKDEHFVWGNVLTENPFGKEYFDVVITNPPHMKQDDFFTIRDNLKNYRTDAQNADLYCYFAERSVNMLCEGGTAVILMSNRWMRSEYGSGLRGFLAEKAISEIVDYGNIPVLEGITVPMSIVTVSNTHAYGTTNAVILDDPRIDDISLFSVTHRNGVKLPGEDKWIFTEDKSTALISKIKNSGILLKKYTEGAIFRGILTGLNEAFVISSEQAKEIINSSPKCSEILKPFLSGRNVKRYATPLVKKYLICMPKGFTGSRYIGSAAWDWLEQTYQPVAEHLKPFEAKASSRRDKGDFWWELRSFRHYDKMSQTKIICPIIVNKISAIMDTNGTFSNDKTSVIAVEDYYLLGLLNSTLMDFYFRHTSSSELLNGYYELKPADLSALPVVKISETNSYNTRLRDTIAEGAKKLMQLNTIPADTRTDESNEIIQKTEREINAAICHLYKLTHDEIVMIENL